MTAVAARRRAARAIGMASLFLLGTSVAAAAPFAPASSEPLTTLRPSVRSTDAVGPHEVLSSRGVLEYRHYRSVTAVNGTVYVQGDETYVIDPSDRPRIVRTLDEMGSLNSVGDLLIESRGALRIFRILPDLGVELVTEVRLTSSTCGSPLGATVIGTHATSATVLWRGTDCEHLGTSERVLSTVGLVSPDTPTVMEGDRVAVLGSTRSRLIGGHAHEDLAALASVSSGLGGSYPRTGVALYDLSNGAPSAVGGWSPDGSFSGSAIAVFQDALYVAGRTLGGEELTYVVDVSDPANPRQLAALSDAPWPSLVKGDLAFGAVGRGVALLDLDDPADPKVASQVSTRGAPLRMALSREGLHVVSRTAGFAWYQAIGIRDHEMGSPSDAVLLPGPTGRVGLPVVSEGIVAVPAGEDGVHLFEASAPPRYVRTLPEPADSIAVTDSRLVVGRNQAVILLDGLSRDSPQVLGRFAIGADIDSTHAADNLAAIVTRDAIHTLDIESATKAVGRVEIQHVKSVALAPPAVYVLQRLPDYTARLWILDASRTGLPKVVATVGMAGSAVQISALGDRVFVLGSEIRVLDVSQPSRPRWVHSATAPLAVADYQPVGLNGYLVFSRFLGYSVTRQPLAVVDAASGGLAVVQEIDFPGHLVTDGETLVRTGPYPGTEVFGVRSLAPASVSIDATCGATNNLAPVIRGKTSTQPTTVEAVIDGQVVTSTVSSAGLFAMEVPLSEGLNALTLVPHSERGRGAATTLDLAVDSGDLIDDWTTTFSWNGGSARPRLLRANPGSLLRTFEPGCVGTTGLWAVALPSTGPIGISTRAAPGSVVAVSIGSVRTVLEEPAPGQYSGRFDAPLPRVGAKIAIEVQTDTSTQTVVGAAQTVRAYLPHVRWGWR